MISTNVAVGAGSIVAFAGFMLGYAIGWRQRGSQIVRALSEVADPEMTIMIVNDLEVRVRRSQA
ncbi:hypothetical protein [Bradyrhizobium sp. Bra78]|uniref:hypothetical protein n=1 Tax=Bradyrhizobium sp. Bra78 TaxID=2926010 RepID=UPI0021C98D32|nr:hypothetical protein [Bradyrhizobium sp. Bra78]